LRRDRVKVRNKVWVEVQAEVRVKVKVKVRVRVSASNSVNKNISSAGKLTDKYLLLNRYKSMHFHKRFSFSLTLILY